MSRPIPRAHLSILAAFSEAGGAGDLDTYGRVTVGPTRHPLAGDPTAWLVLVAHGLIGGEDGRLVLTELGRSTAASVSNGRVREAT